MARGTHGDDTLAGLAWFLVVGAVAVGVLLLVLRDAGPRPDPFAGGLEVELRADVAEARAAGRVDEGEDDAAVLRQTADVIEGRVRRLGIEPVQALPAPPDRIRVRLPARIAALTAELKSALTGRDGGASAHGALAFRLVVEPEHWTHASPAFDAYRAAEILRWRQADADGVAYAPGVAGYAIVPREGTDGTEAWHFIVIRDAATPAELLFGSALLERPSVHAAPSGRQRIRFRIKAALRERFRAFTEANRGRRLALLVDGALAMAPLLTEPLDGVVDITLDRALSRAEALRLARRWVGPGPLRVRCFYVAEARLP